MNPDYLLTLLVEYKYWLFVPLMIIEGPIVTVAAGVLSASGFVNFWLMYLLAVAGDVTGDTIYYLVGRFGPENLKRRFAKWLRATESDVQEAKENFRKSAIKHLLFGKLIDGIGAALLFAAGVAEIPYRRFISLVTIVTIPKSFILIMLGFYFGNLYYQIGSFFDILGAIGILILLGGILFFFYKKQKVSL